MIGLSSKCLFLFTLIEDLKKNGHKVLIFSLSKKMLNLIEELIGENPLYK
jgi:SNF2 family DNA or RNA helicase